MKRGGFTLLEVMIAAAVLVVALLGLLGVFTNCFGLNETARNLTIAINGAQERLEQIRNADFGTIIANYNGPFNVSGLDGIGRVDATYVAGSNNNLIDTRVVICWRQGRNRIIGEDINLNGNLDAGEDVNPTNGSLDSPAQLVTLITEKEQ
ncbi:MAG: prepilin-type N-terminal cleavage/methylation domain-containing protein [Candidatus Omnitrophica bacterium]|nr:prepilin-type N-terminal cleavage/methylation domain-containing protein [Candidatus Omnitrophota bacterium]